MDRGDRREDIFVNEVDRQDLLKTLRTTLPIQWIAERLPMGTSRSLKPRLLHWPQAQGKTASHSPPTRAPGEQLQCQPLVFKKTHQNAPKNAQNPRLQ